MTTDIEVERRVADWLEEGPLEPAGWAIDDAIRTAVATPRRRNRTYGSRTMRWIWAAAAVVAAVIAVAVIRPFSTAGPGANSSASPPPSVAPSPSAAAEPALIGSWIARVPDNAVGVLPGHWTLTFNSAELLYRNPGGASFGQRVTYDGDEFTLVADDCPTGTGEGHYRWAVAGTTLSLTLIADPSTCRSTILGSSPFERAQP
jgi:hypothetical protein